MDRSLAAPGQRRLVGRAARPALGVPRPLTGAASLTRAGIAFAWERRRLRIALIAVLIAIPLFGGGWLWLRHSSLTAVEHVRVSGLVAVYGADAGAIEAALTSAARGMSTLDVKPAALRAAVASYPIVRSVRARASFPHGLRIEVVEQPPVAALVLNGARTAVAADGVVLGSGYLSSTLPLVNIGGGSSSSSTTISSSSSSSSSTTTTLPTVGQSVHGGSLLGTLGVLGAAPAALARTVTRVYSGPQGLTAVLRSGLLAYFGDATRPHAKWIALARVLADPSSAGAVYIDVRLPERPAAGFAPGTARPSTSPSSTETESSSGSASATAAELAAGLDSAVGGGSSSSAGSGASAGSGSSSGSEPAPTGSTPSGETGSTGSAPAESASTQLSETGPSAGAETPAYGGAPGG